MKQVVILLSSFFLSTSIMAQSLREYKDDVIKQNTILNQLFIAATNINEGSNYCSYNLSDKQYVRQINNEITSTLVYKKQRYKIAKYFESVNKDLNWLDASFKDPSTETSVKIIKKHFNEKMKDSKEVQITCDRMKESFNNFYNTIKLYNLKETYIHIIEKKLQNHVFDISKEYLYINRLINPFYKDFLAGRNPETKKVWIGYPLDKNECSIFLENESYNLLTWKAGEAKYVCESDGTFKFWID